MVLEVTEYKGMPQSGAVVSWDFGEKDNYRLGYKGKVKTSFALRIATR